MRTKKVSRVFCPQLPCQGAAHFNVSVRVGVNEFDGWKPEQIAAFFAGIAEVLKAKERAEKGTGDGK
jgi:hypothetical protein